MALEKSEGQTVKVLLDRGGHATSGDKKRISQLDEGQVLALATRPKSRKL
jgi:sugar diacid utilization regulator